MHVLEAAYTSFYPQAKKQAAQGRNDYSHPLSFILTDPFIFVGHLCQHKSFPLLYSLRIREESGSLHKCLNVTSAVSLLSFSIFYYLCLFFLFLSLQF